MSRNPYADTQMQNFWKESINKEASARLQSFARLRGQTSSKTRQFEVLRKKIEDNKHSDTLLECFPPIAPQTRYSKKKVDLNEAYGIDSGNFESLLGAPEMRPVTPQVRDTLYDGFTREGKGRHLYLRQRYDKIPEDKFSFPTCSSWDYGWRLSDVTKKEDIKKPRHGRYKVVENTFYTRNGLLSNCNRVH